MKSLKYRSVFLALCLVALWLCGCRNPGNAPAISSHSTGGNYAGACLICHGEGSGTYQFPVSGPNDHRGRSNSTCLTCHK